VNTIDKKAIDGLLVAGDVFDTRTPRHRAQRLYYPRERIFKAIFLAASQVLTYKEIVQALPAQSLESEMIQKTSSVKYSEK